jgi:hypothetical protein
MKSIDKALAKANSEGTTDGKALAIKLALMAGATAAGIVGTVLVQRAIENNSKDPD